MSFSFDENIDSGVNEAVALRKHRKAIEDCYAIPEDMDDFEKAQLFLAQGNKDQILCVITGLVSLIDTHGLTAIELLLPKIGVAVKNLETRDTVHLARVLNKVFNKCGIPGTLMEKHFFPILLDAIQDMYVNTERCALEGEGGVEEAASKLLSAMESLVGKLDVDSESIILLTEVALKHGGNEENVRLRTLCGDLSKLIASVYANHASNDSKVKFEDTEIFHRSLQLCQDTEYPVRHRMCAILPSFAKAVSPGAVESDIVPELLELSGDEEMLISIQAVVSGAQILKVTDDEKIGSLIVPAMTKALSKFNGGDEGAQRVVVDNYMLILRSTLKFSSSDGETEAREVCQRLYDIIWAKNSMRARLTKLLPKILVTIDPGNYAAYIEEHYGACWKDPNEEVRKVAASVFHLICRIVKDETTTHGLMFEALEHMLGDKDGASTEVCMNIGESIKTLGFKEEATRAIFEARVTTAISGAEKMFGARWRPKVALVEALDSCISTFSSDRAIDEFLPVILGYLTDGEAAPVVKQVQRSLPRMIRSMSRRQAREQAEEAIIKNLSKAVGYSARLAFVGLVENMLETNSAMHFKRTYFDSLLSLAEDPVADIRAAVANILPRVKRSMTMPGDMLLLEALGNAVTSLIADRDVYVGKVTSIMAERYRNTQVVTGNASACDPETQALLLEDERKLKEEESMWKEDSAGSTASKLLKKSATTGSSFHTSRTRRRSSIG